MQQSRLAATLALLIVALGSIGGPVDSLDETLLASWEPAGAHVVEDRQHRGVFLSSRDGWEDAAALPATPYTLELTGGIHGGPLSHFRTQSRQGTSAPKDLPPTSATDIRIGRLSYLDYAAGSAAARSGELSACSTSIPPPLHA